jgi:tRNA pseudouridine55 synthase
VQGNALQADGGKKEVIMADIKFNTEPEGVLIVDKHAGVTSHDIVGKIRRLFGTRKVGHTGTLDPMATGVLVILIGRAAKASEYLVCDSKRYLAGLRLGITTDTEDTSGAILSSSEIVPDASTVLTAIKNFEGEIKQIPPMHSALKVDGKKLCDLARNGQTVEREARDITVHSITAEPTDTATDYRLDVFCSGGTYIRTLCSDIGASLGCGGAMYSLRRVRSGNFEIENAHTIEELEKMELSERLSLLVPTESLFDDLQRVVLPKFYFGLCKNGCEIYQSKISTHFEDGTRVRLCSPDGEFFALGEVREYEGGSAIKPIKFFVL